MGKIARSWSIFKKSLRLINAERKLLIFPLISTAAMIVLVSLIVGGIAVYVTHHSFPDQPEAAQNAQYYPSLVEFAIFAAIYFITMTFAVYCNVAFFSEIIKGLGGEKVSVSRGFTFANSRLKAILMWSLLASTVGWVLKALEERFGILGRIVIKLVGVAWAVASIFAIPSIAADETLDNPIEVLKRSAGTIKRTWGESLTGFIGFGALNVIVVFGCAIVFMVMFFGGAMAASSGSTLLGILVFLAGLLLVASVFVYFYLMNVAKNIYVAALYLYANGRTVQGFSEDELANAFKSKKKNLEE